jgi:NADH dehydrogenase
LKVLVTGATGFVGPSVVSALVDAGHYVRVLERRPGAWKQAGLPCQEAVEGDMTDPESLRRAVEGQDVVVHLVAILTGKPQDFVRVMEQGTRDLVAASQAAGVKRFVLMSALGTSEETKDLVPYYHAKWELEQAVKSSGLEHVILRPSFIFGRGGGALQQFLRIVRLAPVTPIVGPGTQRIQPIWIDDVAAYFAAAVDKPEAANRTFELGGPDVVTWNDFWSRAKRALGSRRPSVHLPFGLMRAQAAVLEKLPKAPVTRDQLTMLAAGDNVAANTDAVDTFGLPLVDLDEQLRRATAKSA